MVQMRVGGRYRLRNGEVWTCTSAERLEQYTIEGNDEHVCVGRDGRRAALQDHDHDVIAEVTDDATSEPQRVELDDVNHPKHYTFGAIEVIDAIEAWKLDYRLGNVVKYVARAEHKNQKLKDLKKRRGIWRE